jgi:hypothetical protein
MNLVLADFETDVTKQELHYHLVVLQAEPYVVAYAGDW